MTDASPPASPLSPTDILARAAQALNDHYSAPSPMAEATLRIHRNAVARLCLEARGEELRWLGSAPRLDWVIRLMRCGLRIQPPHDEETALIAEARRRLLQAGDVDAALAATAALCLLQPAWRLPRLPDWPQVPAELLDLAIRSAFSEPEFFAGFGETEAYTDYLEHLTVGILAAVEGPASAAFRRDLALKTVSNASYLMAYFSERNLKTLYRARARLIEHALASSGHLLDAVYPARPAGRRIRLGVLRRGWNTSAETAATLTHVDGLDRNLFEIIFYSEIAVGDSTEAECRNRADRFVMLNAQNVGEAVQRVRSDDLDILLIATNVTAFCHMVAFMSAFRMARVQAALTLSPATTGFRAMDAFINGELNEPEGAQNAYSERLVLCPGSVNRYDFAGETLPGNIVVSRPDLGLPDDAFVFASGANFYKLTPELLASWARILAAVPGSRLLLYPFNPNWINYYPVELFSRHVRGMLILHGVDPARLHIVKAQPTRAHIHAILRNADLYLDSFPYSGAVSILDPAGVGCPAVLLTGHSARNRQSTGMQLDLDLGAAVTASPAEYEAAAIRLAGDRAAWNDLKVRAIDARSRALHPGPIALQDTLLSLIGPTAS